MLPVREVPVTVQLGPLLWAVRVTCRELALLMTPMVRALLVMLWRVVPLEVSFSSWDISGLNTLGYLRVLKCRARGQCGAAVWGHVCWSASCGSKKECQPIL